MVSLNYTCSMPTNRHRTHDAVDRSFYDAITIRTSDHLLAGKKLQKGYSCSFFAKKKERMEGERERKRANSSVSAGKDGGAWGRVRCRAAAQDL